MTDTTRKLIERMAKELDFYWQLRNDCASTHPLADEARAVLSQPEPEGPSKSDVTDCLFPPPPRRHYDH